MTKKFEEILRGTAEQLLKSREEKKFKGEIVLLIEGSRNKPITASMELSIEDHVAKIQVEDNLPLNEAIKKVAELRDIPKRQVYNLIHQQKKS